MLTILLSIMFFTCFGTKTSFGLYVQEQKNLKKMIADEYNCKGLTGKTDLETKLLLNKCRLIMQSAVMQQSKMSLLNSPEDALLQAEEEYKNLKISRSKRTIKIATFETCPEFTEAYLSNPNLTAGERSIAPYKAHEEYNSNRFPKFISQNRCICSGCIDMETGKETMRLSSQEITLTNYSVFYKNNDGSYREGKEEISAGCTCILPFI